MAVISSFFQSQGMDPFSIELLNSIVKGILFSIKQLVTTATHLPEEHITKQPFLKNSHDDELLDVFMS